MTIDDAVKVLNEREYQGASDWSRGRYYNFISTMGMLIENSAAIAIACRLERADHPTLADEVAAVLVELDEMPPNWRSNSIHRLRAALAREKGE